jgi:hypothetical protein
VTAKWVKDGKSGGECLSGQEIHDGNWQTIVKKV